jgi:hypothetical protein
MITPERLQHDRITRDTERLAHDGINRDRATIIDSAGGIGLPWRVESLLARLERHGDIGYRERLAGEDFQRLFRIAQLDPLHAADMGQPREARPAGSHGDAAWARRKLHRALDTLGGLDSPCGACAWYVLGLELSMRDWALRGAWNGKPCRREVAKGTLIGALGILAKHFRA